MDKQEITEKFNKQLKIENYSAQTIRNYSSARKPFLEYVENLKIKQVIYKEIQNDLYHCKTEKKYS